MKTQGWYLNVSRRDIAQCTAWERANDKGYRHYCNIELGQCLIDEAKEKALFLKEAIADTSSTDFTIKWKFDLTYWKTEGETIDF